MVVLLEACLTAAVTTAVSCGLQEAFRLLRERINQQDLEVAESTLNSIRAEMGRIITDVRQYENSSEAWSGDWRDKVNEVWKVAYELEDMVDRFKIGKTNSKVFAEETKELLASLKTQQPPVPVQNTSPGSASTSGAKGHLSNNSLNPNGLVGMVELRIALQALIYDSVNQANQKPWVISIVGSAAVGKSYLQAHVSGQLLMSDFVLLQACATGKHKDDILKELHMLCRGGNGNESAPSNAAQLMEEIRQHLRSSQGCKRYFIAIDDVQDEKLGDSVIETFRDVKDEVDSIMIVMATVKRNAESWRSRYGHECEMRQLSVEGTTMLKSQCPFHVPRSLEGEGSRWIAAWMLFIDKDEGYARKDMRKVLHHMCNSLPTAYAGTCLHYFSLFPSDFPVRRGPLLRRWIAEGAEVGCDSDKEAVHNGNGGKALANLKTLINDSVIWPIEVSANEGQDAKTCMPPRAMLKYIHHLKPKPHGFVSSTEDITDSQLIRRLSLTARLAYILRNEGRASRLRTLVACPDNNISAAHLIFDKSYLLRVLDLQSWGGSQNFDMDANICNKLKLLRYLSLPGDIIQSVPREIEQLEYLETLDVGSSKKKNDRVVLVHADVLRMPNLKYLIGKFQLMWGKYAILGYSPEKFRKSKLETVAGFVTKDGNGFPELMHHLLWLKKVKIFFDRKASAKTLSNRLAQAITAFLSAANHKEDRSLSIVLEKCENPESALSSLDGAVGSLHSLKLCGDYNLNQFPAFICNLSSIKKLCLSFKALAWGAIVQALGELPQLKYLKMVVKGELSVSVSVISIEEGQFKELERMCLQSATNLPKIEMHGQALENLLSLHLISINLSSPNEVLVPTNQTTPAKEILKNLKEIRLQSSNVGDKTKQDWQAAARAYPQSPQVIFIEHPPRA